MLELRRLAVFLTVFVAAGCGASDPPRDAGIDTGAATDSPVDGPTPGARDAALDAHDAAPAGVDVTPNDGGIASDGGDEPSCGFTMPNPASAGLPNAAAYDTSGAGVVIDKISGLMWERQLTGHATASTGCTVNLTGILSCPLRYATAYCTSSRLGGYDDWRLPSIVELMSLVDYTVKEPQIDRATFPETPPEVFWTSTRAPDGRLDFAHAVSFSLGNWATYFIDEPHRVRCVRAAGTPPPRCASASKRFAIATDIVSDGLTGLTWQRNSPAQTMAWKEAGTYCTGLGGGFRLPSMKELLTIIDFRISSSTGSPLDRSVFGGPTSSYWTSSVVPQEFMSAWAVNFQDVVLSIAGFSNASVINVRCVR